MKIKSEKLQRIWLEILRWLHIEDRTIRMLRDVRADEIREGRMYEHYGRILVARKARTCVMTKHTMVMCGNPDERLRQLLLDNSERLNTEGQSTYSTYDDELAEKMRNTGVFCVMDEVTQCDCENCDIRRKGLPCMPECDMRHTFHVLWQHRQNSTDQKKHAAMVVRKLSGR